MSNFKKNQRYQVKIESLTVQGQGVARIEGFPVFVPHTAVGDECEIALVKVHKTYGYGRLVELLSPSEDRTAPACVQSLRCGGCCFWHIGYPAELACKQQSVCDSFARIGKLNVPIAPIIGAEQITGYRNKAQFPIGRAEDGRMVYGFYAQRSHRIVPCAECLLLPEEFNAIAADFAAQCDALGVSGYEEESHTGNVRHLFLRQAALDGSILMCIVSRTPSLPHEQELCRRLCAAHPKLCGIVLNHNDARTNVILGKRYRTLWGKDVLYDKLCGKGFFISPAAFYQVNHAQTQKLYQAALDLAQLKKTDVLLDLYCGIGTIGLCAADRVQKVWGVEIVPQAIEDAQTNAAHNGITNAQFLCADCGQAVRTLQKKGVSPDVILVDPPRAGCDGAVIEALCAFAPRRIVMVSCNPATAARDCALLSARGYAVQTVQPFDLFPRTGHVEVVVELKNIESAQEKCQ